MTKSAGSFTYGFNGRVIRASGQGDWCE